MKTQDIKRIKTCTNEGNDLKEDVIIVGNMATKRQTVGELHGKPNTESKQEERVLGAKAKTKFDISSLAILQRTVHFQTRE